MEKIFQWLAGIAATVIGGLVLYYLTLPDPPNKFEEKPRSDRVIVEYDRIGGPFLILGPNPEGVWAARALSAKEAFWHAVAISVTNDCSSGQFHINATDFAYYLSDNSSAPQGRANGPTNEGLQYQPRRLSPQWLDPGDTMQGELVFKVWHDDYSKDPSLLIPFLRLRAQTPCPVQYRPR